MTTDWEKYADTHVHTPESYLDEPPQRERVERMADRCVGTVLDVGSSDGFTANVFKLAGHEVVCCDISEKRIARVEELYGIEGHVCDGASLPFGDDSYDTVVLGEILEHCDNPGILFAEACRVARERVVISVPLNGWADPTHLWRISVETLGTQDVTNPTKGQQAVMTWQKGRCWDDETEQQYILKDERWHRQFIYEPIPKVRIT